MRVHSCKHTTHDLRKEALANRKIVSNRAKTKTQTNNTCSCVKCTDANIKQFIKIEEYSPKQNNRKIAKKQKTAVIPTLPYVDLSLLRSDGKMYGEGGGINWGQREGRDPNQSYIAIPAPIQRQKFFPPKGEIFNVLANKTQFMRMVVAQGDYGKAIHSHDDNSVLGAFLRQCLSLPSGCFVHKKDLKKKTTVRFYKVDDENFYMEF